LSNCACARILSVAAAIWRATTDRDPARSACVNGRRPVEITGVDELHHAAAGLRQTWAARVRRQLGELGFDVGKRDSRLRRFDDDGDSSAAKLCWE
jgi:hypothetical protein